MARKQIDPTGPPDAPDPYDDLTMYLSEIKTLAHLIDDIEGVPGKVGTLARAILMHVPIVHQHAEALAGLVKAGAR